MKKLFGGLLIAGAMILGVSFGNGIQDEVKTQEKNYSTELFMVQNEVQDNEGGYLEAVSLEEKTNAPNGYILDNKYEVGDIVEVTYNNDDILKERKITGEELTNKVGKKYSTELFMVRSKDDEGYLNAQSLEEKTNAPYGYVLDNKYQIGDIVEVTYYNDDILNERKITGEELTGVEKNYAVAINMVEDTIGKEYVTEKFIVQYVTDDGTLNAESLEEKTNAPNGYILDYKYDLGDIVEVTYCNDDILSEREIKGKELTSVEQKYENKIDFLMDEGIEIAFNGNLS